MNNLSENGEAINLRTGKRYFVIDALYTGDIKEIIDTNASTLEEDIRTKVFPYTDIPFAQFDAPAAIFKVDNLKNIPYESIIDHQKERYLASDTGLILFVAKDIFMDFVKEFDYDDLLESAIGLIHLPYWNNLVAKYGDREIALMVTGEGGGTFEVDVLL